MTNEETVKLILVSLKCLLSPYQGTAGFFGNSYALIADAIESRYFRFFFSFV
jgi:divalent metal cation (Fe/Co/Zn/Cd) transporter